LKRGAFIGLSSFGFVGSVFLAVNSCRQRLSAQINFIRSGENASIGHLVRSKLPDHISVQKEIKTDVLIVGGGISGLSAAHFLQKDKRSDFLIVEMDEKPGGNSKSGANKFSKYPYGAHYLPIPNPGNKELIGFLVDKGLITNFDEKGEPLYDEFSLCHEPEERLLHNYYWQEGIVPNMDLKEQDELQMKKFFKLVEMLKNEKGEDGKFVFDIPLAEASRKNKYLLLDEVSFMSYLHKEGYTSEKLLWYLRYCCRDDYGQSFDKISAYAGLHYFAARRGKGANCEDNSLLTWPEGNGKLVELLCDGIRDKLLTSQLIRKIEMDKDTCKALVFDWKAGSW